ncbi:MAG TPA: hypothetical protein VMW52_00265 [Phycisphaerae bacterium]|nr:hypothetical protein [Phycisphaerae bacterium]
MDRQAIGRRIIELCQRHGLCHLGSCFSCLPILLDLYERHGEDVIILSNGHAGVALYAVLEARFGFDAEELVQHHGVHPRHDPERRIYCSTGSLGMGLAVAVGYALAGRPTHCILSDGECAEGIVWESLAFAATVPNLPLAVHVNANGWSATAAVDVERLEWRLKAFWPRVRLWRTSNQPFPDDLAAHYAVLDAQQAEHFQSLIPSP